MFVSIYSLASKGYNKLLLFIFSDTIVHMHSKRHLHLPVYSDPKSHLENIYLENFPPFFSHVSPHRLTTGPTPDLISIPSTVTCLKIIFFVSGGSKESLQSSTYITLQFVSIFSLIITSIDREKRTWKCR